MDDVVALVTDLFFQSRIAAAGVAAGRQVRFIASPADVSTLESPRVALVDLDAATDIPDVIRRLKASSPVSVVAFGPHLDTEGRKAARDAGADRVLAKSKFVTELPRIMNDQQSPSGSSGASELEDALAEMSSYGQRMEELGRLLKNPNDVARIYFAPAAHMKVAEEHGEPIILDAADYMDFLAVDVLRPKLDRIRQLGGASGGSTPSE